MSDALSQQQPFPRLEDSENGINQHIASILESISDAIISTDLHFNIQSWNSGAELLYGWKADEVTGKSVFEILPADYLNSSQEELTKQVFTHGYWKGEIIQYRRDGTPSAILASVSVVRNSTGDIIGWVSVNRDITKRKQIEQKLQDSEKRFRALIENSTDVIALINTQGIVLYASPSTRHVLGYAPEELVGRNAFEFIHPDDLEKTTHLLAAILQEPGKSLSAKYRLRHKDGSWRWMEGSGTNLLAEPSVKAIVGNFRDITDRKRLEDEVGKAKEQLETILQNAADGITVQDADGTLVYVNDVAAAMSGFPSAEAMLNTPQGTLFQVLSRFEMKDEGGNPLSLEQLPGRRALRGEKNVQTIVQYYDRATGQTRWSLVKAQPIFDEHGRVQFAVNVLTDLSERKELEQRKDAFISMASHELKTPVTSIKGFTQLLYRRFKKRGDEESLSFLARMDTQLNKLTKLINDLLELSKIQTDKLAFQEGAFDLAEVVRETVENLQAATQSHQLVLENTANLRVFGDKDRIEQVLINLLTNAIKYSSEADRIIIRVARDQEQALVSVQDFGIGIAEAHHQHIFERFYQVTDPMERTFPGLGVGLFISSEIIKRHQGRMWVVSRKGEGATFSFTLPLYQG